MSMMARFVAISADQLAAIKDAPERVGSVFALDAGRPFEDPAHVRERLRFQTPRLVADMLRRLPPEVREHTRRQLGLNEELRPGPGSNSALLLQLAQHEAARQRAVPPPGADGHSVSLEKAWHGLHYLLCGALEPAPGPFGQAVFGGTQIGKDQGYGPARYFQPAQVAEIAAALGTPGLAKTLRARFDAAAMTRLGVYPGTWDAAEDRDWLITAFRELRDFYIAARKAGQAVVTVIE
ncbi:MAG TPA: YfbM family protein [Stellaceae bacterium]|jgi:hypothetical protein|nr:YfbM family protein [Stellaceae bacterium]